ncbi:MAG: hypothetical protein ACYC27_22510 [Armatimonadota bacterium]
MIRTTYRFSFNESIPMKEILKGLLLSTIALEAIHGESAMLVDGKFNVCERNKECIIDAETPVGADLAKVFARVMNMYCGGCFRTDFIECKAPLGDILDLYRMFVR